MGRMLESGTGVRLAGLGERSLYEKDSFLQITSQTVLSDPSQAVAEGALLLMLRSERSSRPMLTYREH